MIKNIFLVFVLTIAITLTSTAQSVEVTGRVVEYTNVTKPPVGKKSFDVEKLAAVTVTEQGTTNSTITDVDGNFKITVSTNSVLVFEYKGYKKQTLRISGQNKVFVVLKRKRG